MLAAIENALIARLQSHRDVVGRVRTVAGLPKVPSDQLLKRYYVDAPALYVVPGRFSVADGMATLRFVVAGVVHNAGGQAKARKGDGITLGCDHLLTLAIRALHAQRIGPCSWTVTGGEMVDEQLLDGAGLAAVELALESGPIELPYDYDQAELPALADFEHLHADLDTAPSAGASEHAKWLQEPPDHTTTRPDAELDVQLPGATP